MSIIKHYRKRPRGGGMKRQKRCWFHSWKTDGLIGVLSMLETCTKCGERRVFNGFTGDYIYYPPSTHISQIERDQS